MKIIVAIILTFQMEKQFIRFRISGRFMINVVMNILFCKHWRRQVKWKKIKKDSFGDKESRNIEPSADVCRRFFYMVQLADDFAVQTVW